MNIYVLRYESSCYDDFHSGSVKAFSNKKDAESLKQNIENLINEFIKEATNVFPQYTMKDWGGGYRKQFGEDKYKLASDKFEEIILTFQDKINLYDKTCYLKHYSAYPREYFVDEIELDIFEHDRLGGEE